MGLTTWLEPRITSSGLNGHSANAQQEKQNGKSAQPASLPFAHFDRAVDDSMSLLMYAAETGKTVDDTIRTSILRARAATSARADEAITANLLSAFTKLAADLHPVTAASLRASHGNETKPTIRVLRAWTCILAVPIILFSLLAFVSSSISTAIRTDITTANELAVKLRTELGTGEAPSSGTPRHPELPKGLNEAEVIGQLQQYAATIRAIDARARQLDWFVGNAEWDPFSAYRWKANLSEPEREGRQKQLKDRFQLPVGIQDKPKALDNLTTTYQDVRSYAQNILDLVSVYYGAITVCLLPVLYALLGTCAYLLRGFEEELRARTFTPQSRANWARFLIAGIGGAVVGLFGNFSITQGASISPLAIAFLVGYAVDVFFSFLEGMLQALSKRKADDRAPATATRTA